MLDRYASPPNDRCNNFPFRAWGLTYLFLYFIFNLLFLRVESFKKLSFFILFITTYFFLIREFFENILQNGLYFLNFWKTDQFLHKCSDIFGRDTIFFCKSLCIFCIVERDFYSNMSEQHFR